MPHASILSSLRGPQCPLQPTLHPTKRTHFLPDDHTHTHTITTGNCSHTLSIFSGGRHISSAN